MSVYLCPIDGHRPASDESGAESVALRSTQLTVSCAKRHCLSNESGVCRYVAVSNLEGNEAGVAEHYGTSVASVVASAARIRIAFVANSYCEYLLNKSILEVTSADVTSLESSRLAFEAWCESKSVTTSFADFTKVLKTIVNRL